MKSPLRLLVALVGVAFAMLWGLPAVARVSPSHPGDDIGSMRVERSPAPTKMPTVRNVNTAATFNTLQDAINAATAGDTLEVIVAVLSEGPVTVDRSLTLRGATGTEVIAMNTNTGSSGDARGWFLVDAGVDLQVRALTFDGNGFLVHQAFRHRGTGSFEDCAFRDIQFNASGPTYAGTALAAFGGTVDVRRCTFQQIGRVGVLAFGAGVTGAVLEDNTYTGKGDGDFLDYGIEVGAGAQVTARRNTITDCRGVASSDGSGSAGFLVTTFFGPGTNATLESNTLTANTSGLSVGLPGDTSTVNAAFNRIVGNAFGLHAESATVTAENDWWGCNGGPGAAGCDTAGGPGTPDFDPWLVLTLAASPTTLTTAETAALTAALTENSDGLDTSGLGTVPDGIPVAFGAAPGSTVPGATTLLAGTASSTFQPASPGNALASATVDNQTVSVPLLVTQVAVLTIPTLGGAGRLLLIVLLVGGALAVLRRG
jgi:hypothetical protein